MAEAHEGALAGGDAVFEEPPKHGQINCIWCCLLGTTIWFPLWMYIDFMNDNCDRRLEMFFVGWIVLTVVNQTLHCLKNHVKRADHDAAAQNYPTANAYPQHCGSRVANYR